ncbi:MAG: carboxypeptidase regulatory-like domain-containing protein [Terriglobia bacterium]
MASISRRAKHLATFVGFALMFFIPSSNLAGQSSLFGALTGHVRGPGGVSVPGATVEITEKTTGERKATWTDEEGNYRFTEVPPGTYKLEISLVGFRKDVREPVPIAPEKSLTVNAALVMDLGTSGGTTSATTRGAESAGEINLQGTAGNLPAGAASLGANGELMEGNGTASEGNLRFNGTAVSGGLPAGEAELPQEDASASGANSFLLSGGSGVTASTPGEDMRGMRERFQQFRERMGGQAVPGFGGGGSGGPGGGMAGGPSLEMMAIFAGGRGGPGGWAGRRAQVNRIRGNFNEQYSNSALDARPYPLNTTNSQRIPSYSEQAGIGFGGPLVIPRIYNGAEKTSFFVNYGFTRARRAFDSFSTVPTPEERAGDFSNAQMTAGPLAGAVPIIYDPLSNAAGPRVAFANNQIPTERMDPAALGLLKYIPLPNLPGQVQNFHLQQPLPTASDRVMFRVGHQISQKDSLNVFYFFNSSRSRAVSSFPDLTSQTSTRGQNLNLSETHTFAPGVINTLAANFNRQRISTLNAFANRQDIVTGLGIEGVSTNPIDWGLPIAQFTNFSDLNDPIPSLRRNQTFRVFDILIWNHGKHNVRLGGEMRRVQVNTLTDPDARGTFNFSGYTTSDFTADGLPVAGTGFDFADFLLGLPQTTSVRFGSSSNYFRSWVFSGFLQDDWRMTSHFTVNYGLRYEYFAPFTEKYGHLSDLTFAPGFASAGVVTGQKPGMMPASLLRGDANNLGPRIGIAYRPWTQHSLVLRAGYGIFFDGSIYSRIFPNMASQPPFAQAATLITSPTQVLTLQEGFPELGPNILKNTYAVDPDFRTPYAQSWNVSLEDEIFRNVIFTLGYVGTKGTKLDLLLAPNQFLAGSGAGQTGLALENTLAFTYETFGAASIYHGLQVGLRRQFHSGYSVSGNYTYSKSIDNAAAVGGAGRTVAQNYLDLQAERGLSSFDLRHRLLINHTYEFPFGDRKRWLSRGGFTARVIGNWAVNGTTTIQSGNPFTARVLGNLGNFGGVAAIANLRADATGQPVSLGDSASTPQQFFNTAAFALPPSDQFGNAGRNTIPGPGLVNFNMSLERFFTFSRERGIRGSFRVSANNLMNTPNWSGLATVVNGQEFGRVTSVRDMRSISFALRLRF